MLFSVVRILYRFQLSLATILVERTFESCSC